MSVPLTPSADKNWITARWACLEESMARSLTVISLLFQSTTHCCYRVYTKFLLTYTAIYRRNRKVLPLGITALQPQSHFHLGMSYIPLLSACNIAYVHCISRKFLYSTKFVCFAGFCNTVHFKCDEVRGGKLWWGAKQQTELWPTQMPKWLWYTKLWTEISCESRVVCCASSCIVCFDMRLQGS